MDMMLRGKRAFITGSTSGIGAECARMLGAEGVQVVINGRDRERADAVAASISAGGGTAEVVLGDITVEESAKSVIAGAQAAFGGIDILVNNVGNLAHAPRISWLDTPVDDWAMDYNQNVVAAVRLIQAFAPSMKERGWGRFIQISSRSAIMPMADLATYGAAKSALNHLTLSLSKELAGTGVTSNGIMPGMIYTPAVEGWFREIARRHIQSDDAEAGMEYFVKNMSPQTVKRLGQPMDIAAAVCFIASPLSDFMTGTTTRIDGGATPSV